jgi:hypothetical protein
VAAPDTTPLQAEPDTAVVESQTAQAEVETLEPEPVVTPPVSPPTQTESRPRLVNPPAPQYGRLTVQARPWGYVLIDNVDMGETPLTNHELAPGTYVITVQQDGCQAVVDTVTVTGGQPTRLSKQLVCEN